MTELYHGSAWQQDLTAAIGNTPLIRLRRASDATGCDILGKAEFMNPGGSVKDRAGLYIIADAEQRGVLKPGGTIVEGTAGNTGIGLTLVGNARGYRCVIVMPETQSQEKIHFLRMIGADLRLVPAEVIDWDFAIGGAAVTHDALVDDLIGLLSPDRMCALAFDRKTTSDGVVLSAYCPMATSATPDAGAESAAEVRTDHFSLTLFRDPTGTWRARRWASLFHGVYEPSEPPER